jgi:YD repeat-containing protein
MEAEANPVTSVSPACLFLPQYLAFPHLVLTPIKSHQVSRPAAIHVFPGLLEAGCECVLQRAAGTLKLQCGPPYAAAGNQITTTNALNQTSLTVYDDANRPIIRVANWDGTTITQTAHCSFPPSQPDTNLCTVTGYDVRGRRSSTQDPMGNVTDFGYDVLGRLITTTRYLDGEPVVTVNHYDALGNRVGQTDSRGNTTTYVYDYLGRLETAISAEGVASTQGYDAFGRVVTTTDGLGHETVTGYDPLGRRVAVTDREGNVTGYAYRCMGLSRGKQLANLKILNQSEPRGTKAKS